MAQAGAPRDLYERPVNRDVAAFIGHNAINFLDPGDGIEAGDVIVGLRPEHLSPNAAGTLLARLETAEYLGSEIVLNLRSAKGAEIRALAHGDFALPAPGSEIRLGYAHKKLHLFDAATGKRREAIA